MGLRKANCYSKKYALPYTRKSKFKKKSYIKAVPGVKVTKMRMGNLVKYRDGGFKIIMTVRTKHRVQMRDNAIEAVRQYLHRFFFEDVGKDDFYFEIKPYPHHIIRENKMLTGAGADRMQTGMALSFGKATGRAAIIDRNAILFIIAVNNEKQEQTVRKLLTSAKARLPCTIRVDTERKKL